MEGFSSPEKRSDRVVLEANSDYWDANRFPRLQRIIFDNTLSQQEAVELVKTSEGRMDVVSELRPLETLRVAQSPYAAVVKNRGLLATVVGRFNMLKTDGRWMDVRLRQAVNYAINRADLIRYATKGNGVPIPALLSPRGFGYNPALTPYPFDPARTRQLLREAGYGNGLALVLIAPEGMKAQATVVGKMLEQAGFTVELRMLDVNTYNAKVFLSHLDKPPEQQTWDLALTYVVDNINSSIFQVYHWYALDGPDDWVNEQPELRQLYEQVIRTVDRDQQQALMREMERHTHDQAYFLFLYSPIGLYAVNKNVTFTPYATGTLNFAETSVTDQHWSLRKQKATVQK